MKLKMKFLVIIFLVCFTALVSIADPTLAAEDPVYVAAGANHTCFAVSPYHLRLGWPTAFRPMQRAHVSYVEEAIFCFGANDRGQLGVAGGSESVLPLLVTPPALHGATLTAPLLQLAAGANHTCALVGVNATTGGHVFCWGSNESGQLGVRSLAASALSPRLEYVVSANQTGLLSGVLEVRAGSAHTCARTAHDVYCWGSNQYGQLGNDSAELWSVAPVRVSGLPSNLQSIAAGGRHNCALTTDQQVYCWGSNQYGQVGISSGDQSIVRQAWPVPADLGEVRHISAGYNHSCVATAHDVLCWGQNRAGQLGVGTNEEATHQPQTVQGLRFSEGEEIVALSSGAFFNCAQRVTLPTRSGEGREFAWRCWGDNNFGQLNNGRREPSSSPVMFVVEGVAHSEQFLALGSQHVCHVRLGRIGCWGDNSSHQLGESYAGNAPLTLWSGAGFRFEGVPQPTSTESP